MLSMLQINVYPFLLFALLAAHRINCQSISATIDIALLAVLGPVPNVDPANVDGHRGASVHATH